MGNLVFVKNEEVLTDSLKIAEAFSKRHDQVLRDIRNLGCSLEFRKLNFELSSYRNSQNKVQPKFNVTTSGLKVLLSSYRGPKSRKIIKELGLQIVNDDIEGKYLEIISDSFSHLKQIHQKRVGIYRIDLFFPEINAAIEIDEFHHEKQTAKDKERENFIINNLGCEILRFNPRGHSSIGEMINKIIFIEKRLKNE